jgi:hypothetical protein
MKNTRKLSLRTNKPSLSARKPPAGLACLSPFPMPRGAGLIQPAGLARPQPGLQPAADVRRWNAPEIQTRVNVSEHYCNLSGDELQDYRAIQPYLEQVIRSGKSRVVRPTPDGPLVKFTATVKGEQVVVTVIQIDNTVFKISNAWVQTGGQTPDEPAIFSLQRGLRASDAVQGASVLSGNTRNTNSQIGAAQINSFCLQH